MIQIVTAANRCLFEDEILEFRRIDCANSARGGVWAPNHTASGIDHFDGDDAVHILAIEKGRLCAASRLVPTSKPHRLGDALPHLAAVRGVPRDPAVYEWTPALAVPKSADAQPDDCHAQAVGAVTCAVVEYCLAENIHALSSVIDARSLPRFHEMGWIVRPLGLPEQVDGEWVLAVVMPIDASMLQATRAFYGNNEPVLMHQGTRPSVTWEIMV
jgi:acyl-homoserine lactone synthase